MVSKHYILKIACQDKGGIVAEFSTSLYQMGGFILTSDQFSDPDTKQFFMRIYFEVNGSSGSQEQILEKLSPSFKKFQVDYHLQDLEKKPNLLILCSKEEHCLIDLLSKQKRGFLLANIRGVVSNHQDLSPIAKWYDTPFYHYPITESTKPSQEADIKKLIKKYEIDYIVLARYMQILSKEFCEEFEGRVINIHHSFLPGFKGAKPYLQAYKRGVKVIGATAHFVTSDLDEGAIIVQETIPVDHAKTPEDLARFGADIELMVLSKAVKYVTEQRVFINQNKTVVFQ